MFYTSNQDGYRQVVAGVRLKTLVYGDKTLLTEARLDKGSCLPRHAHPHEQTGYLVSGRCRFSIGEDTFEVERGDSWCIPGNVKHGVEALADSVAVEVFSPVREDYLPGRSDRR